MDGTVLMFVVLILLLCGCVWALYRSQYDSGFDPAQPHGECQSWIGRDHVEGYDLYCGKKTNRQWIDKWMCKVHNPKEGGESSENPGD